ncbi:MAG: hypothetical protein ACTSWN_09860, partial [Promethearchaeota archaeon]
DDSMPDGWEVNNLLNPLSDDSAGDPDLDGLTNLAEYNSGSDPQYNDTDDDGLTDGQEVLTYGTNATNDDTDFDGMPDGWEIYNSLDPLLDDSAADPDLDALANFDEFGRGSDPQDNDTDNDGLSDGQEVLTYGTNAKNNDTDSDGMPDGWEVNNWLEPLWDDSAEDPDGDTLTNLEEYYISSDPRDSDSDDDGLTDRQEVLIYSTNATSNDTDSDGLMDGDEIHMYFTDAIDPDTDSDGLWDYDEIMIYFTDASNSDSDLDGLKDHYEIFVSYTDPTNNDTDSDGLSDGDEILIYHTNASSNDTDSDGLIDSDEILVYNTNATNNDTDSDGLSDYSEVAIYFTDPTDRDTDRDGLPDKEEIVYVGTNPTLPDTDGDGISDGMEVNTFHTDPNNNLDSIITRFLLFGVLMPAVAITVVVIAHKRAKRARQRRREAERLARLKADVDSLLNEASERMVAGSLRDAFRTAKNAIRIARDNNLVAELERAELVLANIKDSWRVVINHHLSEARQVFADGRFDEAVRKLKPVLDDASTAGFNDLVSELKSELSRVRTAIKLKNLKREISSLLDDAASKMESGSWNDALMLAIKASELAHGSDLNEKKELADGLISRILDKWCNYMERRISDINALVDAGQFSKALSEVDDLKETELLDDDVFDVDIVDEIVSKLDRMPAKIRKRFKRSLESRAAAVSGLLESGNFSDALSLLSQLKSEAKKAGFSKLASQFSGRRKMASRLEKLSKALSASDRLRIDDIASSLQMDRANLMDLLFEWSGRLGFRIDGDYIVTSEGMNIGAFVADLDRQFSEWSESEKDKKGKI